MTAHAKPFLKWAGGKTQLLSQLEESLPTDLLEGQVDRYIEPFVGSGAVFFFLARKYKFRRFYINDINQDLILTYKVIQQQPELLIRVLQKFEQEYLPLNDEKRREYFQQKRAAFNLLSDQIRYQQYQNNWLKRAAQIIFLNKTCFNGLFRFNKQGKFNSPYGSYVRPRICHDENIVNVSRLLNQKNVVLMNGDFDRLRSKITRNSFVYLDPPYKPISKTSNFTSYSSVSFDDSAQIRLAALLRYIDGKQAKFLLSNSEPKNENPQDTFFDEIYRGFSVKNVYARRQINSRADKRGKIKEIVVANYPIT